MPTKIAERIIAKAQQHGEDGDPENEVGDLQEALRVFARAVEKHTEAVHIWREQLSQELKHILDWGEEHGD